ncbi:MAG: hypothetical protein RI953_787 [Pseudomonadota bacterium]
MRKIRKYSRLYIPSLLAVTVGLVFACSDSKTLGEVSVFISPDMLGLRESTETSESVLQFVGLEKYITRSAPLNAKPSDDVNKVSCVGLNVMGPNISSASPGEGSSAWSNMGTGLTSGGKCGYAGVVSQILPVSTSAMIKVPVPYGNSRVVQLVGYTGIDCSKKLTSSDLTSATSVPGVYEIGRAVADIFTRKPEIEIEVDTTVIDRIENPSLTDKSLFVPDLRCGLLGNEEKQFQTMVAGGSGPVTTTPSPTATATATATPTATATATATPGGGGGGGVGDSNCTGTNEYFDGTSCTPINSTSQILHVCGTGKLLVGISTAVQPSFGGGSGNLTNVKLRCAAFTATTRGTIDEVSPGIGTGTASPQTFTCGDVEDHASESPLRAVGMIQPYGTGANNTEGIKLRCRDLSNSTPGTEVSRGVTAAAGAKTMFTCPTSTTSGAVYSVAGIVLKDNTTGDVGVIQGVICRANPTPAP